MNPAKNPSAAPEKANLTGEAVLAAHLAEELPKARQTLKRTRIIGIILILFVGAYIGIISTIMVNFFQPQAAAEVASGMLIQHALKEGPVLAVQVEREIPNLIRQVPDYLITEMPGYRKQLEQTLETECEAYCSSLSQDLGNRVDKLIDEHQAEIKTLLENAHDRDAIRKNLPDFDKVITESLKNDTEGQALKAHIDELATMLKEVEKHMDRLANGKDLTPEEQKARHALALLSKVIQDNTIPPEEIELSAHGAKLKSELKPKQ
jgi:hypothetical protein